MKLCKDHLRLDLHIKNGDRLVAMCFYSGTTYFLFILQYMYFQEYSTDVGDPYYPVPNPR
jgi:hypothetical protein